MSAHYNLYYLFQEDMARCPLPEEQDLKIKKNLEIFYRKIKPPWFSQPPNTATNETQ